jgi:Zn-dependent protease/predicted transcriptional regulator
MRKSFRLTTLFNIPVDINVTWFIIFGLVIFTLAQAYFPITNPELSKATHWAMSILSALLLFSSLLAHEFAHALVAEKNKLHINGITLFVFGGVAHMSREPQSPMIEFKMAIAGPIMSFFLALIFFSLSNFFFLIHFPSSIISITNYLFLINMMVGLFNLIPGFPLDGGRILRSALWGYFKDIRKATAVASGIGKAFAYFLMGLGFFTLFSGALIAGVWFIFIGLFLQEAADVSYKQIVMKKILGNVYVKDLMTKDIITVPPDIPLNKLVNDYFFRYRHASFPVIEDDLLLGLVTLHDVKEIPKRSWSKKFARNVMLPIHNKLVIQKSAHATSAMTKMANNGVGRLIVIEGKKMIGIISQKDIMLLFQFKQEIGGK